MAARSRLCVLSGVSLSADAIPTGCSVRLYALWSTFNKQLDTASQDPVALVCVLSASDSYISNKSHSEVDH